MRPTPQAPTRLRSFADRLSIHTNQLRRRFLVVATALIFALGAGYSSITGNSFLFEAAGAVYFLLLCVLWIALRALTGDVAEGKSEALDEWESGLRDRAGRIGHLYAIWSGLFITIFLYLFRGDVDRFAAGIELLAMNVLLIAILPSAFLAWTIPDPDAGDSP